MAYYSEINKVEFYILGSEENYVDSAATITNKELFKNDLPVPGGCYDAAMGTTEYSWLCSTCLNTKNKCTGHAGSIDVKYPLKSPLFREYIVMWLKAICFKCGNLLATGGENSTLKDYAAAAADITTCPRCAEPHPKITKDPHRSSVLFAVYRRAKSAPQNEQLYNHIIRDIFNRVTDETVKIAGRNVSSHPRNLILDVIRVPPNTIRPDIRKIGGSRSNNSDVTALTKNIVETNETLPLEIPQNMATIDAHLEQQYHNLDMLYYEMIKGSPATGNKVRLVTTTHKAPRSIASRIPKKDGRIRRNLNGKRVGEMFRSVISGDNTLRVDEIGVPIKLARQITIPETVRYYNRDRLNTYFKNKRNIYPGCSGVYIAATRKFHRIDLLNPAYELQDGDVVHRDLIEGDYVGFNRQPSLLFGQIGSHRAKIMEKSSTIRINVSACAPYNADSKYIGIRTGGRWHS